MVVIHTEADMVMAIIMANYFSFLPYCELKLNKLQIYYICQCSDQSFLIFLFRMAAL